MTSTSPTEYDVIVVGFGAAGAAAATQAADEGARVLVLDRGYDDGATALSGGIGYAGGGTRYRKAAGVDDDPDNMVRYLQHEVRGAVTNETLRKFCEQPSDDRVARAAARLVPRQSCTVQDLIPNRPPFPLLLGQ